MFVTLAEKLKNFLLKLNKIFKFKKLRRVKLKELKPVRKIKWTQKQIDMTYSVENHFDYRKSIITISSDYKVLDGNHRYTILNKKYGGEYTIIVKKVKFPKIIYNFTVIIFLPLFFVVGICILTYRKIKKWI